MKNQQRQLFLLSQRIRNRLKIVLDNELGSKQEAFRYSVIFTVVFTVTTYGFLFSNEFVSHDSIGRITSGNGVKFYFSVGRMALPLYEYLRGRPIVPTLIGVLFFIWVSGAVYATIQLFEVKRKISIALISGFMCANTAFIAVGATYVYCLDEYALSVLLAVLAALCFCKYEKNILGVVLLVGSLSLYQSYLLLTLAFCYFYVFQMILENIPVKEWFKKGIKYVLLIGISFAVYYLVWTISLWVVGGEKHRIDETVLSTNFPDLIKGIVNANKQFAGSLLIGDTAISSLYHAANFGLGIILAIFAVNCLLSKTRRNSSKIWMIVWLALCPTVLTADVFLLNGHTLTHYVWEMVYVFFVVAIIESRSNIGKKEKTVWFQAITALLLVCLIWNNVLFANQAFMRKNIVKTASISLATRIIDRMELTEGYEPGVTQVQFIGSPDANEKLKRGLGSLSYLSKYTGMWNYYSFSGSRQTALYLGNYLENDIKLINDEQLLQSEAVKNMPTFPARESVQMIDDILVVKLSE